MKKLVSTLFLVASLAACGSNDAQSMASNFKSVDKSAKTNAEILDATCKMKFISKQPAYVIQNPILKIKNTGTGAVFTMNGLQSDWTATAQKLPSQPTSELQGEGRGIFKGAADAIGIKFDDVTTISGFYVEASKSDWLKNNVDVFDMVDASGRVLGTWGMIGWDTFICEK